MVNKYKKCPKCGQNRLQKKEWSRGCGWCKYCINEYSKQYYKDHIEQRRLRNKQRVFETKVKVFSHYSNGQIKCAICEEEDIIVLSIDHTNGGGCKHRKELGLLHGNHFYIWLIKNNYPNGFRVLCMNCQFRERERIKNE